MFGQKYKKQIKVEGLTCPNCAKKVETELSKIDSVVKVNVDLQANIIDIVSKKEIDNKLIEEKIEGKEFKILYIK